VDLPGYGASPCPKRYTLRKLAGALSRRAPRVCHVVGWSLGALVAVAWACSAPWQVGRMALLAATPCFVRREDWPHGVAPELLEAFERDLAADYEGAIRRFIALQALGDMDERRVTRELRQHLLRGVRPSAAALAGGLRILGAADLRDALPGIARETLVVHGDRDRLTPPAAGRALASGIPGARFELMRGAAHAPFLSRLPEVSELLLEFLDG
jgi:pimeloyl-[acyl-carrier protein] methyl ester esterase